MGRTFDYSEIGLELQAAMSAERLERYLRETNSDLTSACQLYAWNTAVSAAFYGPIQTLEIVLRNAVNTTLVRSYGQEWYTNESILHRGELTAANRAGEMLSRHNKNPRPGRIVAELSFGFWVSLFATRYDATLWRTHLHKLFRPRRQRKELFGQLDRLRTLRNRIAHHEPIFQRDLVEDHLRLRQVTKGLNAPSWAWSDAHSRVLELLHSEPSEIEYF